MTRSKAFHEISDMAWDCIQDELLKDSIAKCAE